MEKENNEKSPLPGILEEFRTALQDEIAAIEKSGQSSTLLNNGKRITTNSGEFWYRFNVDYAPNIPADTPCKLIIGKSKFDVTVVGFEENEIIISSPIELPDTLANARLENSTTILMERLIKRIEDNFEKENYAWNRIISISDGNPTEQFSCIDPNAKLQFWEDASDSQKKAFESALKNDITYIWGPPGTGKTTVIGNIIQQLFHNDRTVLVVSHTNTAVDGAIKKVEDLKTPEGICPVLRIGVTNGLPDQVKIENHVKLLGEKLFNQQEELKNKSAEEAKQISEKSLIIAKIEWVENSSILQIETKGQRISLLTQQRNDAKDSYTNTDGKVRSLIAQTKEIDSFAFLEKKKKSLLNQLANAKSKKESLLKEIESLRVSIDEADIEIKKHQSYKELLAELNKFMPAPFIQKKLDEKTVELNSVQQQKDETQDKISENETIISRRSRNAFSSFFSRSTIQQAEAQLTELRNKQDDLRLEIDSISLLKQNYENQLIQRSALQKQADDIHPQKTIDYWRSELSRLSQRKNLAMQERSTCDKEITQNSAELEEVNSKLTELAPIVEELNKLKSQLEKEKARYDQAATSLASCTEDIQKLIDLEFDTYGTFHERGFDRESITEQIITLRKIYDETAMDVRYQDQEKLRIELAEHRKNISRINEELKSIAEKIADLERQAIHQAKIIGATLTKTYLSDVLQEMKFDTVILDEASMAPIPALWCASMLAERNIIIVGDFLQLPPIVMATTPMAAKWLGRDIFAASGIQEKAKKENQSKPLNFVMLDEQFRMEKEIADIANIYYGEYALLRSTSQNSKERKEKRSEFYKWYKGPQNRSVEIVDTSEMHAWVTSIPRGGKTSRLNCFSAALVVEMAFQWIQDDIEVIKTTKTPAKTPKILIVAPYRPHIDRINQLVQFEYARRGVEDANLIKAGTIHSFQGSEADIVIFDLVLDEPHWKANLFLQDKDINDELRKQFNVAVTRAIFKLFIVGNIKYCKKNAKNNALGQFLEYLTQQKFPVTNAKEAFPDLLYAKPRTYAGNGLDNTKHIICREDSFYDFFVSDITHFKEILIIYSPFITNNRISMLLPYFHDAILSGKKIVVVTKAHEDRGKRELEQYKKLENELISIGVEILHKKGMHEKLVFVDDSAVWMGSLNALSFSGETGEIMHRHCDRTIAAEYKKIYDISYVQSATEKSTELLCPICGKEMQLCEGDRGVYWKCINNDYTRSINQQYPYDGVLRCHCGGSYHFAMKNQPRWVCNDNPKHFQKMRKNDLKLPKMAALIPAESLETIKLYFSFDENDENRSDQSEISSNEINDREDEEKVFSLFELDSLEKRAEAGDAAAQSMIARSYYYGEGVSPNLQEAIKWYTIAAENGYSPAQYSLGTLYENGDGVRKSMAKAFRWYLSAAEQGEIDAQVAVAYCYYNGDGTSKNYSKAFEWFYKSAQHDAVDGLLMVGCCYYNGTGTNSDYEKAFYWFEKAAENGSVDAMYNLGQCYEFGNGIPRNKKKAIHWYTLAADNGDEDALEKLSLLT